MYKKLNIYHLENISSVEWLVKDIQLYKRLDFDKMTQGELLKARQIITPYLTPKEIKNIEECINITFS